MKIQLLEVSAQEDISGESCVPERNMNFQMTSVEPAFHTCFLWL